MTSQGEARDGWIAAGLSVLVVAVLYVTAPSIGYARDEGFYFQAAGEYWKWLELLFDRPAEALSRPAVDAHFRINAEHPSLMKLLFATSHGVLHEKLGWIPTPGLAMRLPGMLMSGCATGLVALWGMRAISRWAGVVGALLFITLPRVFHHAHLACFDVPIAATILATVYAYSRAMATERRSWALATGVCYGFALDTKHNAWTLPAVFAIHWVVTEGRAFWFGSARQRWVRLRPWVALLTLGPLVLFLLWPWLWFDTFERLRFWVEFHLRHDYYNMEFLGQTYHRPPMPRGYAWVMTLGTVPLTTLLLALVGALGSLAYAYRRGRVELTQSANDAKGADARGEGAAKPFVTASVAALSDERTKVDLLWLLGCLVAYAPWWFDTTPIFGGTKHWMTAYPFLCLFAARGAAEHLRALRERFGWVHQQPKTWLGIAVASALLWLGPPLAITANSLPFGLSTYTPLVGGAPGAATLGLNRTFWGYTSIEMAAEMHRLLPSGGRVFVHDTALQSWDMHQRDGAFARNLYPSMSPAQSSIALYHYEPHMARVEYQIWEAYGTTVPHAVATFDGVPVLWLYARPEVTRSSER